MVREWWAQFYPDRASNPDKPIYFNRCWELLEHVQGVEATHAAKGIFHVHGPATATEDERRQLREAGYDQDVFSAPGHVFSSRHTIR